MNAHTNLPTPNDDEISLADLPLPGRHIEKNSPTEKATLLIFTQN